MHKLFYTSFFIVLQLILLVYLFGYHCFTFFFVSLNRSSNPAIVQMPDDAYQKALTIMMCVILWILNALWLIKEKSAMELLYNPHKVFRWAALIILSYLTLFHVYHIFLAYDFAFKTQRNFWVPGFLIPEIVTILVFGFYAYWNAKALVIQFK